MLRRMRGSFLHGPVGSRATLAQLAARLQDHAPVVVLSSVWLASELAESLAVVAVTEPDQLRAARRAAKRARKSNRTLFLLLAGEELPLGPGASGALVIEGLSEIEGSATEFLLGLLPTLKPDGIVVSLETARTGDTEAKVSEIFLASAVSSVMQDRPAKNALITFGTAPHPAALQVLRSPP